jgi:hypothetical protein
MRSNLLTGFYTVGVFLTLVALIAVNIYRASTVQATTVNAAGTTYFPYDNGGGSGDNAGADGSGDSDGGLGDGGLHNPLRYDSLSEVLLTILDVLVIFMIPVIIFFIIYAGFLYVTARGNQSSIETAHRTLLYAVIGGLLILGARALLAVIQGTVNMLM